MALTLRSIMQTRTLINVTHFPLRTFKVSSVIQIPRNQKNWNSLARECEERTKIVLTDQRKLKSIYTPDKFTKNISELFKFFPLSPERLEAVLMDNQEILDFDAASVISFIQVLVEAGDFDIITQEEALLCLARCPSLLRMPLKQFRQRISNVFGVCGMYDVPWNVVMVVSPISLVQSPRSIGEMVVLLTKWVTAEKVRDVIGNNPTIFEYDLEEIEEKIRFLTYTMNVSSYRVAMTPKSLTHDLDFFKLRFEFLSRSGHYRHPDPGARSAVPAEASPLLHLVTDTDDERFVHKCAPGLSMEEFNVFKTMMVLSNLESEDGEDEEDELEGDENHYTRAVQTREKAVFDPNRFRK